MDQHIYFEYMRDLVNSQNLRHTLVYKPRKDFHNNHRYICMNQHHFFLCIQRSIHKEMVHMDPVVLVELYEVHIEQKHFR